MKSSEGIAMLGGSIAGGVVAQTTNLGVPYLLRAGVLVLSFATAFTLMHDIGFTPRAGTRPVQEIKNVLRDSIANGLARRPVRWVMLTGPFTGGVMIYAFYAMQPYLLELWATSARSPSPASRRPPWPARKLRGGLLVPHFKLVFGRRTSVLLAGTLVSVAALAIMGLAPAFWVVITLLSLWALMFAAVTPVRQSYLNALIESKQRATVLSFDSLLGSSGAAVIQPLLGKTADVRYYPISFVASAAIQALAIPFCWLARRERMPADQILAERPEV